MQLRIAVAMSGGVDSTIAALELKERGYEVIGVHFNMLSKRKKENLRALSKKLGIDIRIIDVKHAFRKEVIEYFKESYKEGLTPNPCAICNRKIKIRYLREFAKDVGAQKWATGHYARVKDGKIFSAKDEKKDQSYFLALVDKEDLKGLELPLGKFIKTEVKALVREHSIEIKEKESQDVCFAAGGLKNFFKSEGVEVKKGPVLDEEGRILGEHDGYQLYTLGQRKGLGVATGERVYVVDVLARKNAILIGGRESTLSRKFTMNFVNFHVLMDEIFECECKVRSTAPRVHCLVKRGVETIVEVETPVLAVPGQVAAFYNGEMLVGGGVIDKIRLNSG